MISIEGLILKLVSLTKTNFVAFKKSMISGLKFQLTKEINRKTPLAQKDQEVQLKINILKPVEI